MNEQTTKFLRAGQIDSYQKFRLLLLLYQQRGKAMSVEELSQRLYVGNIQLLRNALDDLAAKKLINSEDTSFYKLSDDPTLVNIICSINREFEDPLTRQRILRYLNNTASLQYFAENRSGLILATKTQ